MSDEAEQVSETARRMGRIWDYMQRFVLMGSVCGVAAGGVTATVQHSSDVVDVLSFLHRKVDPDAATGISAPPPIVPEPVSPPAPPKTAFGPLPLVRVRVVDVTPVDDGGGWFRGAVEWDFELRDALTGLPLELEHRYYRGGGPAEAFGREQLFAHAPDNQVGVMIDGWYHDRLDRRDLRIRELVHLKLDEEPAPVRVRAFDGTDWGTFEIRLEVVDGSRPRTAKKPS